MLLLVALDCLKDEDSERPSAHELCERVAALKEMETYIDCTRITQHQCTISSKEEEIQRLRQELQEKDRASRQLEEKERQRNQQLRWLEQEEIKSVDN